MYCRCQNLHVQAKPIPIEFINDLEFNVTIFISSPACRSNPNTVAPLLNKCSSIDLMPAQEYVYLFPLKSNWIYASLYIAPPPGEAGGTMYVIQVSENSYRTSEIVRIGYAFRPNLNL